MNQPVGVPLENKAIRFAPSRNQAEPAASLWKVWTEGNEVYASSRSPGGLLKISVHASGQIHQRLEAKLKQDMAPLMQLGTGPWLHAFELRFLLSDGALSPIGQRESLKKNKKAYLIPTPEGFVLHANLIIGPAGIPLDCPIPVEFTGGQTFWRTRLGDGRLVVLVARLLKLDDQNRNLIKFYREELKPNATFSDMPSSKHFEIQHLHWSEGGNVVLVVPMGEEAFRSEQDFLAPGVLPTAPRQFRYQISHSTAELIAPNGQRAAVIELAEVDKQIELAKGLPKLVELGLVTMWIDQGNLIPGSKFIASPCRLVCVPNIAGASPRSWEYVIPARFDGSSLSAELRPMSTGLQNKNLNPPVSGLDSSEEITISIPTETVKLTATLDLPSATIELVGRFTLRDRR
jgi:hypothetical protein